MSRKRSCIETEEFCPTEAYFIERQKLTDICLSICASIARLEKTVTSLDQRMREQRYAIEGLQREISDLQSHAMHGAFGGTGSGTGSGSDLDAQYTYRYL